MRDFVDPRKGLDEKKKKKKKLYVQILLNLIKMLLPSHEILIPFCIVLMFPHLSSSLSDSDFVILILSHIYAHTTSCFAIVYLFLLPSNLMIPIISPALLSHEKEEEMGSFQIRCLDRQRKNTYWTKLAGYWRLKT